MTPEEIEEARSMGMVMSRVATETARACTLYGPDFNSAHEAYAVLLEEVNEFRGEVRKMLGQRDKRLMLSELIQVAAVAVKYAAQLERELTPGRG